MVTNKTIMDSFIKQDYTQGSSSSRKKLVAGCFPITVHSDGFTAVGHASLKQGRLRNVVLSISHQVLLRHLYNG